MSDPARPTPESTTPGCAKPCAMRPTRARAADHALREAILAEARAARRSRGGARAAGALRRARSLAAFWSWLGPAAGGGRLRQRHGGDAGRPDVVGPADGRDRAASAGARAKRSEARRCVGAARRHDQRCAVRRSHRSDGAGCASATRDGAHGASPVTDNAGARRTGARSQAWRFRQRRTRASERRSAGEGT